MWGEYDSGRRLSDRISEITLWKKSLEACAEELDAEMDALTLVSRVVMLFMVKTAIYLHLYNFKDCAYFNFSSIRCIGIYYLVLSYRIVSYRIVSYLTLPYVIYGNLIFFLSYFILSYLVLPYLILSYLTLCFMNFYSELPKIFNYFKF